MAGLNNLLSDTQQTSTTLPSWYDQAQQNVVSQGNQAFSAAPQLNQTVAQGAINQLQPGASNAFTQAQGSLNQISSGAANPWITDASGNVSPNTNTAMGGLFAAQDQELNQLLPEYTAPTQAGAIGSGNFGSLRGQTAVDKSKADAFAKLNASQMQAALTNQSTGAQAAAQLGNVGQQGINAAMNVGQAQQNAPFQNVGNLASLLGTVQAPTTVSSQKQLSPLSQAATLANTLQGTGISGGLGSLLFGSAAVGTPGTAGYKAATSGLVGNGGASSAIGGLGNWLQNKFTTGADSAIKLDTSGNPVPGSYPLADGGTIKINADGSQTITGADGTAKYFDSQGNQTTTETGSGGGSYIDPGNPDNRDVGTSGSTGDTITAPQYDEFGNIIP